MNEFDIPRVTMRNAMSKLISEGYIKRERGIGTKLLDRTSNVEMLQKSSFGNIEEFDRKNVRVTKFKHEILAIHHI